MSNSPESEDSDQPPLPEDREAEQTGNPLGSVVDPLTKFGIDTVRDIAAAVESTRKAGSDVWKAVNFFGRLPGPPAPLKRVAGALNRSEQKEIAPKQAPLDTDADLRAAGDQLISKSQVPADKPAHRHPAFQQILMELEPDEVRMLRFLAVAGVQPSIDIRTKTLFQVGSERLARGINMIAEMAGCRWPQADQEYLANLSRLGLVTMSIEPVADYRRYALLEVQPRALEAAAQAASSISVYRSIDLTKFGRQFCDVCIDTTGYNAGGWATDERGDKIIGKGPPDPAARAHKH